MEGESLHEREQGTQNFHRSSTEGSGEGAVLGEFKTELKLQNRFNPSFGGVYFSKQLGDSEVLG